MKKQVLDYIQEEKASIEARLDRFMAYGYASELGELVDEMLKYKRKLKELETKEMEFVLRKLKQDNP